MRRCSTYPGVAAFIALVTASIAAPKLANAEPHTECEGVRLDVSDDLAPAWREAAADLRAQLVASDAPCVTVNLVLEPAQGNAARLLATTADGRHTERALSTPATLVPTVLGLVATLPPDSQPSASRPPPAQADSHEFVEPPRVESSPPLPDSSAHLWLGVSLGGRVAEPTFLGMMEVEGRFTVEMNRWLVLAAVRYGSSFGESMVSTDDSYDELAGALGIGRRFPLGPSALDVALVPSIVSATLADDDETGIGAAARTELRVGASFAWWVATEDGWRVSLSADTDVAPRGLAHGVRSSPDEPPIPAWTLGLHLGASGRIL